MADILNDLNPYAPPATNDVLDVESFARRLPTWPFAITIGVVAGLVSVLCTALFNDVAATKYGKDLAAMPYWLHQVRAGTFYLAGCIIAMGFGLYGNGPKLSIAPLLLAFGGFVCLAIAEVIALTLGLGVIGNVALRSLLLSLFLCKFLNSSISPMRLGLVIAIGAFAWPFLFVFVGFTLSWSLAVAVQLKIMLNLPAESAIADENKTLPLGTFT